MRNYNFRLNRQLIRSILILFNRRLPRPIKSPKPCPSISNLSTRRFRHHRTPHTTSRIPIRNSHSKLRRPITTSQLRRQNGITIILPIPTTSSSKISHTLRLSITHQRHTRSSSPPTEHKTTDPTIVAESSSIEDTHEN